jgi:hypothetical protein
MNFVVTPSSDRSGDPLPSDMRLLLFLIFAGPAYTPVRYDKSLEADRTDRRIGRMTA